jgi:hypothetical protein
MGKQLCSILRKINPDSWVELGDSKSAFYAGLKSKD